MNDEQTTPNDEWIGEHPDSPEVLATFAERIRSLRVDALPCARSTRRAAASCRPSTSCSPWTPSEPPSGSCDWRCTTAAAATNLPDDEPFDRSRRTGQQETKMTKTTSKRPRYVVRPCDDRDTADPRINWDVADTHERDDAGFPISVETHCTRALAREAARERNEQAVQSATCANS